MLVQEIPLVLNEVETVLHLNKQHDLQLVLQQVHPLRSTDSQDNEPAGYDDEYNGHRPTHIYLGPLPPYHAPPFLRRMASLHKQLLIPSILHKALHHSSPKTHQYLLNNPFSHSSYIHLSTRTSPLKYL